MPEWRPAPAWVWEYNRPPFRGVLIMVYLSEPEHAKRFGAHVETPYWPRGAPYLFETLLEAQHWIEQAVECWAAAPEQLERRRGERRQDNRRSGGRRWDDC